MSKIKELRNDVDGLRTDLRNLAESLWFTFGYQDGKRTLDACVIGGSRVKHAEARLEKLEAGREIAEERTKLLLLLDHLGLELQEGVPAPAWKIVKKPRQKRGRR